MKKVMYFFAMSAPRGIKLLNNGYKQIEFISCMRLPFRLSCYLTMTNQAPSFFTSRNLEGNKPQHNVIIELSRNR